jgi:hypothetical protein
MRAEAKLSEITFEQRPMKSLLVEYLRKILNQSLNEYTEEERRQIGIPLDAETRGGKWFRGDEYIGKVIDGKFVSTTEAEKRADQTDQEDMPAADVSAIEKKTKRKRESQAKEIAKKLVSALQELVNGNPEPLEKLIEDYGLKISSSGRLVSTVGNVGKIFGNDKEISKRIVRIAASRGIEIPTQQKEESKSDPRFRPSRVMDGVTYKPPPPHFASIGDPPRQVEVRPIIDEDGNIIDTSTREGREQAAAILRARSESLRQDVFGTAGPPPVEGALQLRRGNRRLDKFLGEYAELVGLLEALEADIEAHLLPDSEALIDMVLVTRAGPRFVLSFVSIKSSESERVGVLGANAVAPLKSIVAGAEIERGGRNCSAETAVQVETDFHTRLTMFLTRENLPGEDESHSDFRRRTPVTLEDIDRFRNNLSYLSLTRGTGYALLVGNELKKLMKENPELTREEALDQAKKNVNQRDIDNRVKKLVQNGMTEEDALKQVNAEIEERIALAENTLSRIEDAIRQKEESEGTGAFRMSDMDKFLLDELGAIVDDSKRKIEGDSDLLRTQFNANTGESEVRIVLRECVTQRLKEQQATFREKHGRDMTGTEQLVMQGNLGVRTRETDGVLRPIINMAPPNSVIKPEDWMTLDEYDAHFASGKTGCPEKNNTTEQINEDVNEHMVMEILYGHLPNWEMLLEWKSKKKSSNVCPPEIDG